jgi:hypothetical protein
MITLGQDCLLFELANGEKVPFTASMISVELVGETSCWIDPEVASQAAKAVFHYFKTELGRQCVTADEFARAMEKVLRGFKSHDSKKPAVRPGMRVIESDLSRLARESGGACELLFFPSLRSELRQHLRQRPGLLKFSGLRACVKQIAGVSRWTPRCRDLEDQIVHFLRECAGAESDHSDFTFVVE